MYLLPYITTYPNPSVIILLSLAHIVIHSSFLYTICGRLMGNAFLRISSIEPYENKLSEQETDLLRLRILFNYHCWALKQSIIGQTSMINVLKQISLRRLHVCSYKISPKILMLKTSTNRGHNYGVEIYTVICQPSDKCFRNKAIR